MGLSPRGRGKPHQRAHAAAVLGSIPAWAGETFVFVVGGAVLAVYPRVGGGNGARERERKSGLGLSPRGRGKLRPGRSSCNTRRSIPAWAGETYRRRNSKPPMEVYPRVGGGNCDTERHADKIGGLSPRGRGKLPFTNTRMKIVRSIPAWAGETVGGNVILDISAVYPRVGGGNPPSPSGI